MTFADFTSRNPHCFLIVSHLVMLQSSTELESLIDLFARSRRIVVLTGAGCSTESGIPDYRGPNGTWHRRRPMNHSEFLRSAESRRYFWARNYKAWPYFSSAMPNRAHRGFAELERRGRIARLVTQNVDGLHQRAGSNDVINLHGQSSEVICLECTKISSRAELQQRLERLNAGWTATLGPINADGDVDITMEQTATFVVPSCDSCSGPLKPHVVFFGDSVPRDRVEQVMDSVSASDLLLVAGSSLTVWSGFRFARAAADRNIPLALINLGETRADSIATIKLEADVGDVIEILASHKGVPLPWERDRGEAF